PGREIGRELLHPGLDAALLAGLRQRVVLSVRDDLRGNWAAKGGDLRGCGALQFRVAEIVGHHVPPSARSPGLRQASSPLAASPGLAADSWTTTPPAWEKSSGAGRPRRALQERREIRSVFAASKRPVRASIHRTRQAPRVARSQ